MKNSQYWQKRIDEIAKLQYDKADEAEKELIKAYQRADKYIEERINLYYARYAKENDISLAESKKILSSSELNNFRMSLDEFIDKAQNNQDDKWTKELNEEYLRSRISRYDALRYEISNKVKELKYEQLNITKSHLKDAYSDTYYRTAYELEKGTGIGVNFAKLNDKAIENAVYTKWLDNKNFAGRMDDDKVNLISNLNKIITQGMITGSSSDDMVNKLMKATKISRNRAINLIQTETTFIIGKANTDMYKEFDVEEYDVIETLDNVTCETCSAMDGKRFKVSEKQEGLNAPPFHTRCRGTTIPVTKYEHIWGKSDRIARDENGKTYYKTDIGDISFEKYMDIKINGTQDELDIPSKINNIIQKNNDKISKRAKKFLDNNISDSDIIIDLHYKKPFAYNYIDDKIYINTNHQDFGYYNFIKAIIHESFHKFDLDNAISISIAKDIDDCIKKSAPLLNNITLSEKLKDNMSICDIIACVTGKTNVGNYGHSSKYFSTIGNVERELIANLTTEFLYEDSEGMTFINNIKPLKDLVEKILKEYKL